MSGTKAGAKKMKETLIKKLGGVEAYEKYRSEISRKGGLNSPRVAGFDKDPQRARTAGSKGGKERMKRYYDRKTV